jgi:hypothetical protein
MAHEKMAEGPKNVQTVLVAEVSIPLFHRKFVRSPSAGLPRNTIHRAYGVSLQVLTRTVLSPCV